MDRKQLRDDRVLDMDPQVVQTSKTWSTSDFDVEYQPTSISSQRNLRRKGLRRTVHGKAPLLDTSSSDTNKILNIADILLQAKDQRTGQMKVFVELG